MPVIQEPLALAMGRLSQRWLQAHNFPENPIVYFQDYIAKINFIKEVNPVFIFEDDPRIIKEFLNTKISILVIDWPYNEEIQAKNCLKIKDYRRSVVFDGIHS